jgi:outer membrane protein TolC
MEITSNVYPKLTSMVLLACFSFIVPAGKQANASERFSEIAPLEIEQAVRIALGSNPKIKTLAAHARALSHAPSQAGALPDPMLSLNAMNLPTDSFDLDQEPMTQMQIMVSQKIPYPGKRKLKREVAQFEAEVATENVSEIEDVLTGKVRSMWWQLFATDRALEIIATNKELLQDFVEIAKAKYAVGKGLQQDVLLAELELSRLQDREARLKGQRGHRRAILNGLLDRSPDFPLTLPKRPSNNNLPELSSVSVLAQEAMAHRNLVRALQLDLEAAEKDVQLARKGHLPDFNVGIGYADRRGSDPAGGSRSDFLSVMFSVNLPVYAKRKQNKALEQRISNRDRDASLLAEARRQIETDIGAQAADYAAARDQTILLEETIIPQAQQTVSAMLAGYQVNKVDFLNVLNGQIMLYNASINYWNALASAKQSLAKIAASVGKGTLYE